MNYHDYLFIHICSFVVFTINLILYLNKSEVRTYKVLTSVTFILTGISGVILSSRFGLTGTYAFPTWLTFKYAIWISMGSITILFSWKIQDKLSKLYWPFILLTIAGIFFSIYKPI